MVFPSSRPAEQAVAAEGIAAFLDAIEADPVIEPHGLIIQRHGRRIVEGYWAPHSPDRSRLVYSLSKTFTGTALALALGEGRLGLDDLVSDHLPELFDGADERTRRMKVRHLASMASGHDREILGEALQLDPKDPVGAFFRIPPDAEPGTLFAYNQPPVLALATLLARRTGVRLVDYLRPRVFGPLGIGHVGWWQLRPGIDLGFSGVYTNLDAIARLGQLYLDDGVWNGTRLLPEGFVAEASRVQIPNPMREEPDWQQGYGFQLWMSRHGYRGDGAFGQYMVVLPQLDAVVAMFSCTEAMQRVLDLMWEHLLPAMADGARTDASADEALAARVTRLSLPTARLRLGGDAVGAVAPSTLAPVGADVVSHRSITSIDLAGDRAVLHEHDAATELRLSEGWHVEPGAAWASSATALEGGRVVVDVALLETPHRLELVLDPASGTFTARWPIVPLFLAGLSTRLADVRAPDRGAR